MPCSKLNKKIYLRAVMENLHVIYDLKFAEGVFFIIYFPTILRNKKSLMIDPLLSLRTYFS